MRHVATPFLAGRNVSARFLAGLVLCWGNVLSVAGVQASDPTLGASQLPLDLTITSISALRPNETQVSTLDLSASNLVLSISLPAYELNTAYDPEDGISDINFSIGSYLDADDEPFNPVFPHRTKGTIETQRIQRDFNTFTMLVTEKQTSSNVESPALEQTLQLEVTARIPVGGESIGRIDILSAKLKLGHYSVTLDPDTMETVVVNNFYVEAELTETFALSIGAPQVLMVPGNGSDFGPYDLPPIEPTDVLPMDRAFQVQGTMNWTSTSQANRTVKVGLYLRPYLDRAAVSDYVDPDDYVVGEQTRVMPGGGGQVEYSFVLPAGFVSKDMPADKYFGLRDFVVIVDPDRLKLFGFNYRASPVTEVTLYDPIPPTGALSYPENEEFYFTTRFGATDYLSRRKFKRILFDTGYSRAENVTRRSYFNGREMPIGAFRIQASNPTRKTFPSEVVGKPPGRTVVLWSPDFIQGADESFNPFEFDAVLSEPAPPDLLDINLIINCFLVDPLWYLYVFDYRRQF